MRQSHSQENPTEDCVAFIVTLFWFTATCLVSGSDFCKVCLSGKQDEESQPEWHAPSFFLSVSPTVGLLQWERRGYLMRRQCESTWGINGERKRGRKANKLRVIERKWWGQSVIKTQGRWGEDRGRREGMVIDCLVSPHAPVIELIGVAKTKRREVSVTAEPSKRAIQVKLW